MLRLSLVQQQVVSHKDGPLLVVAGPGAGKTRVLTERVRQLFADPDSQFKVLALTFTNKAANEMRERLEDVPEIHQRAFIGTLHSFCVEVLANRGKPVGIDGLPTLFESMQDRKQVLLQALHADPATSTLITSVGDAKAQSKAAGQWLEQISDAKNRLLLPEMVEDSHLRHLYEIYDAGLRASQALDYDDLLLLTYRLFQERPKIADFYRRQYRYICIDEAQDLNFSQYGVITALCGDDHRNIMMVGDPKQAIFVFNGANPKYMEQFAKDFMAERIVLNENYRSSQAVVSYAVALDPSYKVEGQLPIRGEIVVRVGKDEAEEAEIVLKELTKLQNEGHPDIEGPITLERCAILGRTRFVFSILESQLKSASWPYYKKFAASGYQSESDLLGDFELGLRVLCNPRDRLHIGALISRWKVKKSAEDFELPNADPLKSGLEALEQLQEAGGTPAARVVWNAIRAIGWTEGDFDFAAGLRIFEEHAQGLPDEERATLVRDIEEWRKHWNYYLRNETGGHHSLRSFLSQVALGTTQQPKQDGLALLTVHSSKGLEFDVVFVIGMNEDTFPDYRAKGPLLVEENRNMFVAVTRSKRILYLTYPKLRKMPWGALKTQQPSRFLEKVPRS